MRIVRYYPRLNVGDGGITNAVRGWARSLSRAGADVVVAYDDEGPGGDLGNARTLQVRHRGEGRLRVPTDLADVLDAGDVLVLHSAWTLHNVAAARAANAAAVPFLLEPRGAYDPHILRRKQLAKRMWWWALERDVVRRATAVHVFFEDEREHLRGLGFDGRFVVAPNGIELPPDVTWEGGRDGYTLWLGRFDIQHKGLDLLVDAVDRLPPAKRPQIRLHGPDWRNNKRKLQDVIRSRSLEAWVTVGDAAYGREKWELFRGAAVFVYPSRWEGFGISLGEAAALGMPVVVTPYPFGAYLARSDAAFLARRSPEDLGRALVAATGPEAAAVGRRAAAVVATDFAWERVARSWLDQLERAIEP